MAEARGAEREAQSAEAQRRIARAFWITAPGAGEIRDEAVPEAGPDEIVVRALFSGISRGTEALVFRGLVPPTEYAADARAVSGGTLPGPVKYGYSSVGTVERGPRDLEGRAVFALYPASDALCRARRGCSRRCRLASRRPAPSSPPTWRPRSTACGMREPQPGDRLTVIGAGAVGCLVAYVARRTIGCEVELVDTNPEREAIARALGVRFAQSDAATPGATVVVHASGSPAGLSRALAIAAFEAVIVEMSWYGCQPVALPLGEAFHSQRLTIRSSQVGHVARPKRAQFDRRARMQLALSLLDDAALDVLITGESPFEDLPQVMAGLAQGPAGTICHRIR